jgi:hypothetical protein
MVSVEVTAVWGDRDGDHDSGKRPGLARRVLTRAEAATGDQACGPRRDWPGGGSPHRGGASHHHGAESPTWGIPVQRRPWLSLRHLVAAGLWLWLGETRGQVIEHEVPGYDRPWARIFERFERQMQRPAKPDIFSFD